MRLILVYLLLFFACTAEAQTIEKYKIESLVSRINKSDSVLIVNFWATWCGPCIEELPYFHEMARKYKDQKVKLLLVTLDFAEDYPDSINAFVKKHGYDSEVVYLDETNADHFCPQIDQSWSGAIPATLIVNNASGYRNFSYGKMKPSELEANIRKALGK